LEEKAKEGLQARQNLQEVRMQSAKIQSTPLSMPQMLAGNAVGEGQSCHDGRRQKRLGVEEA